MMSNSAIYNPSWGFPAIARFQQATLIYNPVAGKLSRQPDLIQKATDLLAPMAVEIRLRPTTGPETAGPMAAEAVAAGSGLVLAAGGDGTINEVIQGLAGSNAALGILPAGTANVLAVETGIGGDLINAAQRLPQFEEAHIALGRLIRPDAPPHYFAAMAGAGLDAQIVRRVSAGFKRKFGKVSYWIAGFGALGETLREFDVSFDGQTRRASFALISRVKNYGGDLEIARHASLLRDEFGIVLFEGASTFRYLKYFAGVLLNRLDGMSGVTVAHASTLDLTPLNGAPVHMQIDGEYAGLAPARIEIVPRALRLLVPPAYLRRVKG